MDRFPRYKIFFVLLNDFSTKPNAITIYEDDKVGDIYDQIIDELSRQSKSYLLEMHSADPCMVIDGRTFRPTEISYEMFQNAGAYSVELIDDDVIDDA